MDASLRLASSEIGRFNVDAGRSDPWWSLNSSSNYSAVFLLR